MDTQLAKVVFAGDGNVGKTTLIRAYTEGKFQASRMSTIGVDFFTHTVVLPEGTIKLSIWDMAGQAHFQFLRSDFYRGSRAAALVYDVTASESLEHLSGWHAEILKVVPDEKFIVVGNKIDLNRHPLSSAVRSFADGIGAQYLETSAKSGEGIDKVFKALAELAVK